MMAEEGVRALIVSIIEKEVSQAKTVTRYRQPLVAFADAAGEGFPRLKELIGEHHLLPGDLLPTAQTVVSFFLPFAEEVVRANEVHPYVAREWAIAYIETNELISHICRSLTEALKAERVEVAWELPTYNFDKVKLVARWSHRSVAALAGLGTFGLHRLLITDSGCAGRFGSLVIGAKISPSAVEWRERCLYFQDKSCVICVKRCPVQAVTEQGLDKALCYRHLLEVDAYYNDLPLCDVCGKCAIGPCSFGAAV